MVRHDPGPGHPERPARLSALQDWLRSEGVAMQAPTAVHREDLLRVHTEAYVDAVLATEGAPTRLDPDTATSAGSIHAARLAAGAAVDAVDAVLEGRSRTAYAAVRPPGHHAEADRAMGFCLFNNIAIAAAHAAARDDVNRVLVVDWDVHHGNGTQHAFEDRDDVLFFSAHRWPFYPGTGTLTERGTGAGTGFTVNVPLPAGMTDGAYAAAFDEILVPAAQRFAPDLILVSAGFDAHRRDPLGGMGVSEEGFAVMCAKVRDLAEAHAGGRLVLVMEGGYDLDALTRSTEACLRVMGGEAAPKDAAPSSREWDVIRRLRDGI